MTSGFFDRIFIPETFREAVDGQAWLQAMLDAEAALAAAESRVGLVSESAARSIKTCCDASLFDPEKIGDEARSAGNPVPPLVRELTKLVSERDEEASRRVHKGATSQDITDTAAMLVSRRALTAILAETDGVTAACARLAENHRDTLMPARTLLQQALPTTFGLKAAGWLVALLEARRGLVVVLNSGLAAQLGGAAGTSASLGDDGIRVLEEFSGELDLAVPVLPWHTNRTRIASIGDALSTLAGVLGKIAGDIILLSQTEVAEVSEPAAEGRGGSSTLPHKRNPILCVTAAANVRRVQDLTHTLKTAMPQEHERAAGAWHAEWQPLSDALALTGGAAVALREATEGLEVHSEKMRENLDITKGLLLAENVATLAAEGLGRLKAHDLVQSACGRVLQRGNMLREELAEEPALLEVLSLEEIDAALDPASYLGSAGAFVNRALKLYSEEPPQ